MGPRVESLLRVLSTLPASFARFSLTVKVDQEKNREEGSKKDSKVGTELNLEGEGLCWEGLNNRVHGEGGGGNNGRDSGDGGLLHVETRLDEPLGN